MRVRAWFARMARRFGRVIGCLLVGLDRWWCRGSRYIGDLQLTIGAGCGYRCRGRPAAPSGMTPQRRGTPMDSYTITITPNDDSGNSTTLTVDTAAGQARITSVHMHAPDGLTGGQMPSVDVGGCCKPSPAPHPPPPRSPRRPRQ